MTSNIVKLNEALGIESIDDILSDLDVEQNQEGFNNTLKEIDVHVKSQMEIIQQQKMLYQTEPNQFNVHTMESALNEVSGLIEISKGIITKVYEYVQTSSLLDPEIISAGAKMIEATRVAISDYIDMYKNQIRFFNTIQLEMIKQKNKKELIEYKMRCDVEKNDLLGNGSKNDIDMKEYTQESIIKALNTYEKNMKT
jgi:predicted transcriptional regulator